MNSLTLSNSLGKNILKHSISSFRIEEEKGKVVLLTCFIGKISVIGEVIGNHSHYTVLKDHYTITDEEKKMVEDFVWDLKCDLESLSSRYNYTYEVEFW